MWDAVLRLKNEQMSNYIESLKKADCTIYSMQFGTFPAIIDYFNDGWSAQLFVLCEN